MAVRAERPVAAAHVGDACVAGYSSALRAGVPGMLARPDLQEWEFALWQVP
jgi:hypothetical protein